MEGPHEDPPYVTKDCGKMRLILEGFGIELERVLGATGPGGEPLTCRCHV